MFCNTNVISTTCENQIVGKVSFGNKSSLEYCGFGGYSLFLREIKCKIGYECFSFHRRIREESFVIYPTEGTSVFIEDYEHFRIPDDVVVVGVGSDVIRTDGNQGRANGTSFSSPIMCGMVTCLWQACPTLTAKEVIELVRRSGDRAGFPDNIYGYGVPDMWKAYNDYKSNNK